MTSQKTRFSPSQMKIERYENVYPFMRGHLYTWNMNIFQQKQRNHLKINRVKVIGNINFSLNDPKYQDDVEDKKRLTRLSGVEKIFSGKFCSCKLSFPDGTWAQLWMKVHSLTTTESRYIIIFGLPMLPISL
jgi:hypothetical protein